MRNTFSYPPSPVPEISGGLSPRENERARASSLLQRADSSKRPGPCHTEEHAEYDGNTVRAGSENLQASLPSSQSYS